MARPSARAERRPHPPGLAWLAGVAVVAATTACAGELASPERAALVALGPWPPAPAAPPSAAAAAALGERLFFSPRLGESPGVRCASCHEPWRRYTDGRPRAVGVGLATGARNTPSLLDVGQHRRFGWDGARTDLAVQSLRPLDDPREMPAGAAHVASLVREDAELAGRYADAFGAPPGTDDEAVRRDVGGALAAYVATLATPRTPFDAWRDARLAGAAVPSLPAAARHGFALFTGRAGCIACHAGPAFSDDATHASLVRSLDAAGRPDDGAGANAFRTPGLRDVAATGPWMHDGSVGRLCDALRPHAQQDAPPVLTADDRRDLVAFLEALRTAPRRDDEPPAGDCRP